MPIDGLFYDFKNGLLTFWFCPHTILCSQNHSHLYLDNLSGPNLHLEGANDCSRDRIILKVCWLCCYLRKTCLKMRQDLENQNREIESFLDTVFKMSGFCSRNAWHTSTGLYSPCSNIFWPTYENSKILISEIWHWTQSLFNTLLPFIHLITKYLLCSR